MKRTTASGLIVLGILGGVLGFGLCGALIETEPPTPQMPPVELTDLPTVVPTTSLPDPITDEPEAYYRNCDAARRAGAAPLRRGEPGYRAGLDRNRDGVACE